MNKSEFLKIANEIFTDAIGVLDKANIDYANDDDALSNFKEAAEILGCYKYDVLLVYWFKHFKSITNHIKGKRGNREPIKGRFLDCINYLVLCYAMIVEDEREEIPEPTWDKNDRNSSR